MQKGDEVVIFASTMNLGNKDKSLYYVLFGFDGMVVNVCDQTDVKKDIYDPIEKTTGQKYVEIHPVLCKHLTSQQAH